MYKYLYAFVLILFFFSGFSSVFGETVPFTSDRWIYEGGEHRIENYQGREALVLKGGIAYLKDADFLDGVIEFDIAVANEFGFQGVFWRMQDAQNYEEFYIRPVQSGQADANQYTPVFNDLSGWQLYHGAGFGAPTVYRFDQWMHVKIVVSGKRGAVYIMDMDKPAFVINELKREPKSGSLGLKVTNFAPGRFADFRYERSSEPLRIEDGAAEKPAEPGTLMNYSVSTPFAEETLKDVTVLPDEKLRGLKWSQLPAESTGTANLARITKISDGNTVFVKIAVNSDREQIKKMQFGYSDRIIVFAGRKALYSGNNVWRSRDFRYLGTIGFFDEVYLPLKKGANEVILAVSEGFGGWGVKVRFPDMNGIELR